MKSKLAIFDASWIAYRARHSMKNLSFNGDPTGVVFGFLEQLRHTCFNPRVATTRVVVCFDSKQSLRRDEFPAYKRKRGNDTKTPEELEEAGVMRDQLKLLRKEILPEIGFPCLRQNGLESDDVMARAASQLKGEPGVMITADGDLYQCITNGVHWFDPQRDLYLDAAAMIHKYRVGPHEWAYVKSLCGCHTDDVPGIPGVGEKTAVDFIWKLLKTDSKKYLAITSPAGKAIVERNARLVTLPHPATRPVDLTAGAYSPDALFRWAEKLGFKSYFDPGRKREWEMFFSGATGTVDRMTSKVRRRDAKGQIPLPFPPTPEHA